MAHRKSSLRIAKHDRIERWRRRPPTALAAFGLPTEALLNLEANIVGRIVLPGEPDYEQARQESNPAFQAYPQIIVFCAVVQDIAQCLAVAINYGLWIAVRSGGHSTAGYSVNSGMVIDVSALDSISINKAAMTATVGPGINFDHLNPALGDLGLHVPSGACGDVRVGGFMQGGGFGYTSRKFGINCDCVKEVVVMLWDASLARANASQNADLYWAVRGGTGGNFGILTEITYNVFELAPVWAFAVQWDIGQAAAALLELQRNYARAGAPAEVGYMMNVGFNGTTPVALIQGMFCGSQEDGKKVIASLLAIPTAQLLVDQVGPYWKMDQYLDDHPYSMPNINGRPFEDKICGYVVDPLTLAQWQEIVDQLLKAPSVNAILYTEAYGGAIAAYPPLPGNAFVHRAVDMNVVVDGFWFKDSERPAVEQWLLEFDALRQKYFGYGVYQNYPRGAYANFREDYWGEAFDQLLAAKRKYDPHNIFHYPQSISPYPEGGPARKPGPLLFKDTPIVRETAPRISIK